MHLLQRIRGILGRLRRSAAVRSVVVSLQVLKRRLAQRWNRRHIVGVWTTTRAYVSTSRAAGATYQPLDAAVVTTIPAARFIGPHSNSYMGARTMTSPATGVARLPHACVVGHKGAVVANDRRLLWDLSYDWPGLPSQHEVYAWQPGTVPLHDLPGTTVTLATMGAEVNYFHFLVNTLPRIDLLRRSGQLQTADRFLISGALTPWLSHVLALVGVPTDRVIGTSQFPAVRCETLLAPSLVLDPNTIPPRPLHWLREEFLPHVPWDGRTRRIFIDRSDAATRRVTNLEALRPHLERNGVEIVQLKGLSLLEQIELFQQAELVIGNHGAGLTNIAFCRPGTKVVQLIPQNMGEINFRPLALYANLDLRYMVCPSTPESTHRPVKDHDLLLSTLLLDSVLGPAAAW